MQITVSDYVLVVGFLLIATQHDDNSPVLQYVQVDPNSTWTHDSNEGKSRLSKNHVPKLKNQLPWAMEVCHTTSEER
jgi:hypothetical protein